VAIYTGAKALSRWPINDESTLTTPILARSSPVSSELFTIPARLLPYAQLIRLRKSAGTIINFPFLYGSLYAASVANVGISPSELLVINLKLFLGSFMIRSWATAWNDIVDRDLDKLVERCKSRPLARGAISVTNAYLFTGLIYITWFTFMTHNFPVFVPYGILFTVLAGLYPFTKRVTAHTPVYLGSSLASSSLVGCAVTGLEPWRTLKEQPGTIGAGLVFLFTYYIVWTMVFETVYAFQDIKDDAKAGINSMAVLYQRHIKLWFGAFGIVQVAVLVLMGRAIGAGSMYYFGAPLVRT
jgi:4-hydroxybenzoate polyprenyltransferase